MSLRCPQPSVVEDSVEAAAYFDEPIISIPDRNDSNTWHHFSTEEEADAWTTSEDIERAKVAAGAWSDIDYDEMMDALCLIRLSSVPTLPIELD